MDHKTSIYMTKEMVLPTIDRISILTWFVQLKDSGLNLDIDLPFEDYVNYETEERTYSDEQAEELNAKMDACHDWCDENKEDIYRLALAAFQMEEKFRADKKVLTDGAEILQFFVKETGDEDHKMEPIKALHVYKDHHYINEQLDGSFTLEIENMFYTGPLQEMEVIVYDNYLDDISAD